jgi:hypothetical protein
VPAGAVLAPEDANDTLSALLAAGMPRWQAVGAVSALAGPEALRPRWDRWIAYRSFSNTVVAALDEIAVEAPETANAWLAAYAGRGQLPGDLVLEGRSWATSLPTGVRVAGHLDLNGTAIAALPDDLEVGGYLNVANTRVRTWPKGLRVGHQLLLQNTAFTELPPGLRVQGDLLLFFAPIQSLPAGLKVEGCLGLEGCRDWDGKIPADAQVGKVLWTDRHPDGLLLVDWRRLHPHGERN